MGTSIVAQVRLGLPTEGRLEYTRKAFNMLPRIHQPRILDIGCGRGLPTIELAKASDGDILGIDINQSDLDELGRKARELHLSDRVKVLRCSMFEMDFADEYFHLVWSEGSIHPIGFERGLREWRRLIKPLGFLVVHDMCWLEPDPPREIRDYWERTYPSIATVEENLGIIPGCGYVVLGYFPLPERAWWDLYFGPLEARIHDQRSRFKDDPGILAQLNKELANVDLYRKYSRWYGSAFYVMQKSSS